MDFIIKWLKTNNIQSDQNINGVVAIMISSYYLYFTFLLTVSLCTYLLTRKSRNVDCKYSLYMGHTVYKNSVINNLQGRIDKQCIFPGIGKFQYLLLGVSGAIYATCAVSSTTLSFVLPSAECDFNLTSADKGRLSAVPLFGKIFLQHGVI